MPAPFTHQFICGQAISVELPPGLAQLLNANQRFVYLGSESPDLPYLSSPSETNWANVMHYEKTNTLVLSALEDLRQQWGVHQTEEYALKLAWLFGYVSHMIADASIHPIVNATVGPYVLNQEEHRLCEMTQDSMLFHELSGGELRYSGWLKHLESCHDDHHFEDLMEFWKIHLLAAYPDKAEEPDPASWFTTYKTLIKVAADRPKVQAVFRHLGRLKKYFYETTEEIERDNPGHTINYYHQVKLPGGRVGSFKEYGFEKTVRHVIDAWQGLYQNLTSGGLDFNMIVRSWDLDLGIDMNNPPLYYW